MYTIDTTRVYADDPFSLAVHTSQIGFPDRNVPWKPKAVILCPAHDFRFAFAATGLIHHPMGAPILFVERFMPAVTRQELVRLVPSGEQSPAQVLLVGPIPEQVERDVQRLGMTTARIGNQDPAYTAYAVADVREEITRMANMPLDKSYMIVSEETFSEALPAPGYAAHSGTPILFTTRQGLPAATVEWIKRHLDWNGYLIGSRHTIGERVETEISELSQGKLNRIKGRIRSNSVYISQLITTLRLGLDGIAIRKEGEMRLRLFLSTTGITRLQELFFRTLESTLQR
ncbi:cell wall-binding repeat-containing protein [Paenibacillus antri]|uniref:Cell wall-binding repeat-containing protein n=1 Tax=Paenibacillus antri TaxID=2582848 RepID=A0A5R9G120_9BACL|nr:cell wall-binding repeat-containing protein [Paenibacillus antri]TLS50022.1 cell wall-binding repeat-containing protein [Paenibacillus antri]